MRDHEFRKIIFIAGSTAVGKTEAAIVLAKKLNAEIVSCDSMQVYKELNVASNKPSQEILKQVPHHLINVVSIKQDFNVALFNRLAIKAIRQIHRKNKLPLVVGGSGLYVSVLLDGIFEGAKRDSKLRNALEGQSDIYGRSWLHARLGGVDPQAASKIHPHDTRRVIRALEVFTIEKRPISQVQKERQGLWGKFAVSIFALNRSRQELYERIDERVETMFQRGLVEEVKGLLAKRWSPAAQKIIGVKEVTGFLNGDYDLKRAQYLLKLNTRHYAKRQLTWLRKDKRLDWIMIGKDDPIEMVVEQMIKRIKRLKE